MATRSTYPAPHPEIHWPIFFLSASEDTANISPLPWPSCCERCVFPRARRMARSPGRWTATGLLITALLLLIVNARDIWMLLRKHRLQAHPEYAPRRAATLWYERMTRRVARCGWRKSAVQTPVEYVTAIEDANLRESVARFTRHYESARFGDSAEDASRLPKLYEEITTSSAPRPTPGSARVSQAGK